LDGLSPYARVGTAVMPFVAALLFRLLMGRSRLASMLISVTITWFAVSILLAPFSPRLQQDLLQLVR
jgi:hypothetical protein